MAYGSDAFGGVIRTRTRLATPGEPLGVRYGVAGGTGNDLRGASLEMAGTLAGGGLTVGGNYRELR